MPYIAFEQQMNLCDWSSDVCSSDLDRGCPGRADVGACALL